MADGNKYCLDTAVPFIGSSYGGGIAGELSGNNGRVRGRIIIRPDVFKDALGQNLGRGLFFVGGTGGGGGSQSAEKSHADNPQNSEGNQRLD